MRYFIEIAYQGRNYHGWQIQNNAHSVQQEIQDKISLILRQTTSIVGSGRTDTGVHASQQFAHFDCDKPLDKAGFLYKMNRILPPDIRLLNLLPVKPEAHARFDATRRRYEYHLSHHKQVFGQGLYYHFQPDLSLKKMNEAAKILLDHEDFQAFSKVKTEVKHFRCQMLEAYWEQRGEMLVFTISANRFLRGMVRAIVGTLLEVGKSKMNLKQFQQVITSRSRQVAGAAVPPEGLFLTEVAYPWSAISLDAQV